MKLTIEEKASVFLALYVAAVLATNLIGGKLTVLFGQPLSVAILVLPFIYVILSATNEVFGGSLPRRYVLSALAAQLMLLAIIVIALWLPAGPRQLSQGYLAAYGTIFQTTIRIVIGSVVAYLVGQFYTIWIFNVIKKRMHETHAWLRYNLATVSGQFLDTFLFMFIAFYSGDAAFVAHIAFVYFLFKALAVILSTPFFYGAAAWLRVGSAKPSGEPMMMTVRVQQRHRTRARYH